MPGCCATGCTNRTGHDGKSGGKVLFSIPVGERNKERREIWLQRINRRRHFEATKNTRLCEDHFTEDQFEKNRADGLRKLKPNAVPSIFSQPTKEKWKTRQVLQNQANIMVASAQQTSFSLEKQGIPLESIVETLIGSSDDCYESRNPHMLQDAANTHFSAECSSPVPEGSAILLSDVSETLLVNAADHYEHNHRALKDHAYVSSRDAGEASIDLLCTEITSQTAHEVLIVNCADKSEMISPEVLQDPAFVCGGDGEQMLPNLFDNEISLQPAHGIVIASVSGLCEPARPADANYHSYHKGAHYADEKIAALKRMLMNEGKRRRKAEEERDRLKKSLGRILGEDQLHMLEKGKMRGSFWSEATMKKAMRLRMVCGNRGYNFVKDHVVPLPSERTLQKHIVKLGLTPKITPCAATLLAQGGTSDGQLTCDVFELKPG